MLKFKKITVLAFLMLGIFSNAFAQAKKPTIMVVPSDAWCIKNGYITEFNNQGTKVTVPDYKRAFQENTDLILVVTKIGQLMSDRGFPLKNMESAIKTLESEAAENAVSTSKSGSSLSESPVDKLKKTAKADIWMQLTWTINQSGPKKSVTFTLQGLDAYTDKQIAAATGTGAPSFSAELPVLLEEAVLSHVDNFNNQLQTYFDDLFKNGREIIVRIKKWDSFDGDLEKDYGGEELGTQIEKWMSANTVAGRFNTTDATESMMLFEQVRIPMNDASGKAIDARGWLRGLQKHLKDSYQIESKLSIKGLGQATIVIGEK
jgi:hypothetical protein